jgi:hypothetical protein
VLSPSLLPRWGEGDRNLSSVSSDRECRHYILYVSLGSFSGSRLGARSSLTVESKPRAR